MTSQSKDICDKILLSFFLNPQKEDTPALSQAVPFFVRSSFIGSTDILPDQPLYITGLVLLSLQVTDDIHILFPVKIQTQTDIVVFHVLLYIL